MKIKICAIGECMMELSSAKNALYKQSIAGDTLNFSSYLDKNIFDEIIFYKSSSNVGDDGLETVDIEKTHLNTKKIYQDSVMNMLNDVKITYKPKR